MSFRRVPKHAQDVITTSIVPAADTDDIRKEKLAGYSRELKELTSDKFREVLDEVCSLYRISSSNTQLIMRSGFSMHGHSSHWSRL